jgi:hypothetical protein
VKEIVGCMKEASCGSPMFLVAIDENIPGYLLRISSDTTVKDEIILTNGWLGVRKIVEDDGESVTFVFDYDLDGKIDAVEFSHSKSPLIIKRDVENMSDTQKKEFQNYFDSVITRAQVLRSVSWSAKKP